MRARTMIAAMTVAAVLATGCGPQSRRAEIEQRKAALRQKEDSTLTASQRELAGVDSALQAAEQHHQAVLSRLKSGSHSKAELQRLGDELTVARLRRDSLQVRFEVLCGKIKYIHRKQEQRQAKTPAQSDATDSVSTN